MATTKIKFRPSSVAGKEGTLFFQVIHKREVRQVSTTYKVFPHEWDAVRQEIVMPPCKLRKKYLLALQDTLMKSAIRLRIIILSLTQQQSAYTAEDIVQRFLNHEKTSEFEAFAENIIQTKRKEGHTALADKYQSSLNSFKRFLNDCHPTFIQIDDQLIRSYECFLKQSGVCNNTISFYMRNLRAIYNKAVQQGAVEQRHPFAHVYTGIAKTIKRAINTNDIQRLKKMKLTPYSTEDQARDVFLFSLYTCGMSMIDIAHLKKTNINDGYIIYNRRKTGQRIIIRWEACMQELADKYATNDSPYLLPILTDPTQNEERQYRNKYHVINKCLKKLGQKLSIPTKLTTYVARHSWASIAKNQEVPIAAISEAMGHTSEQTTRIYLKSLSNTIVDNANMKVLSAING